MLWGVVRGPLHVDMLPLHLPLYGGASPSVCTPTLSCWLPCVLVCFGDIGMSYGDFSLLLGELGVFPIYWGFWGH